MFDKHVLPLLQTDTTHDPAVTPPWPGLPADASPGWVAASSSAAPLGRAEGEEKRPLQWPNVVALIKDTSFVGGIDWSVNHLKSSKYLQISFQSFNIFQEFYFDGLQNSSLLHNFQCFTGVAENRRSN